MVSMVVEQAQRNLVERGLGSADLGEDIDAVAVLLDHALDAADLTLDPSQPREQLGLGRAVSPRCVVFCAMDENIPLPPRGIC